MSEVHVDLLKVYDIVKGSTHHYHHLDHHHLDDLDHLDHLDHTDYADLDEALHEVKELDVVLQQDLGLELLQKDWLQGPDRKPEKGRGQTF